MFEPIKTKRISDEIFRQIHEVLLSGSVRAGERLPTERELAQQFATSRNSVREALRGLEQRGIIYTKKGVNGGVFVADMDHQLVTRPFSDLLQLKKVSIHHIAEVRGIFEPQAAYLAAERATSEHLKQLEETMQEMAAAVESGKPPAFHDLKFHKLIAEATQNPILQMLADSMLGVASRIITNLHPSLEVLRHVLACHFRIYKAVRDRNPDAAREAMAEHIVDVQRRLTKDTAKIARAARRRVRDGP
jgi:GntR family transcriptional repressor for pyruvate dehydrogenase complex